ncbi:MAG: hypothetical protein HOH88_01235 [Flavobacteriales bacterium]|mgnify:CR=1 FL=1|nr:hypothetical protein [Flavobacteriales bacterium]
MKKLVILMLVAMVPFLTMAQKRTKKDKETKTETTDKSSSVTSNFMIIKGVEVDMTQEGMDQEEKDSEDVSLDRLIKKYIKPVSRFYISYDVGPLSKEAQKLTDASKDFRSMAQAVNASAEYGWEFMNATVVIDGSVKIHYYYMKR